MKSTMEGLDSEGVISRDTTTAVKHSYMGRRMAEHLVNKRKIKYIITELTIELEEDDNVGLAHKKKQSATRKKARILAHDFGEVQGECGTNGLHHNQTPRWTDLHQLEILIQSSKHNQ